MLMITLLVMMSHQNTLLFPLSPPPQAVTNPTNTVYATKRMIGRGFKDDQTQKEAKVRQSALSLNPGL